MFSLIVNLLMPVWLGNEKGDKKCHQHCHELQEAEEMKLMPKVTNGTRTAAPYMERTKRLEFNQFKTEVLSTTETNATMFYP